MKKKPFELLAIMVCLFSSILVACGSKDEKIVDVASTTQEYETESSVEESVELGYVIESQSVDESSEEDVVEFTPEIATKKMQDIMVTYQKYFLDLSNLEISEAEAILRDEIRECSLNYYSSNYTNLGDYGIKTKDGIILEFRMQNNYENLSNTDVYFFKARLFEEFFIQVFENGNEDFMLVDYVSQNNFNDILNPNYSENEPENGYMTCRYTTIPYIYDILIKNEIVDFSIENIREYNTEINDFEVDINGNHPYYVTDFVSETKNDIMLKDGIEIMYFDEYGNFMF